MAFIFNAMGQVHPFRQLLRGFTLWVFLAATIVVAVPVTRSEYRQLQTTSDGDTIFEVGNITYLANTQYPKGFVTGDVSTTKSGITPFTVVTTNETIITRDVLQKTLAVYTEVDDVFNEDFLEGIYITSTAAKPSLDTSALEYLGSLVVSSLLLDTRFATTGNNISNSQLSTAFASVENGTTLLPGPYLVSASTQRQLEFATVYRLYADRYRDFLFGAYEANDGHGNFKALGSLLPKFWDPMIPVPSRLYSLHDPRPLAGQRVGIKDLYDVKGLQTSGGSQAWALITPRANASAPSVQQIINLGGIPVGKQKLAQFASGADPWDWQDEHYPFNPRGDGWLTCSASSSGGACSIAAYDWLDYAIGSDTGSSMRRPAAVAGVYGGRPSQGMMNLERVLPLGAATDTAGVFSRSPQKWIKFAKAWYAPQLHQSSNITGLSPLVVPDTQAFAKRILYPVDYLPLNNSAAEPILDRFIADLVRIFGMRLEKFNFTETVENAVNVSDPVVKNLDALSDAAGVIDTITQWDEVGKPLTTTWAELFDGRFPPIDSARRSGWVKLAKNDSSASAAAYAAALATKRKGVEWYETHLQFSTNESCSESIMLGDIGTGGKPSFREQSLNESPAASFLAQLPRTGAKITWANICPIYGCADYTVPIGQVPYFSNVTFHEEMVPVTVNIAVKRGCDFVFFNMVEKLVEAGVLKDVMTGRTAF